MNINSVLTANAVIAGAAGISLLVAPEATQIPFGVEAVEANGTAHVGRLLGAYMLSFGIIFWFLSGVPESAAKTAVLKGVSLSYLVGVVASFSVNFFGPLDNFGWSIVVIYAVFGGLYAYYCYGGSSDVAGAS